MEEANYPVNIGNYRELNELGRALILFNDLSGAHRKRLDAEFIKKHPTKTFRDCDDAEKFYSLFTGTKAVPLPKDWLDVDTETEKKRCLPD